MGPPKDFPFQRRALVHHRRKTDNQLAKDTGNPFWTRMSAYPFHVSHQLIATLPQPPAAIAYADDVARHVPLSSIVRHNNNK